MRHKNSPPNPIPLYVINIQHASLLPGNSHFKMVSFYFKKKQFHWKKTHQEFVLQKKNHFKIVLHRILSHLFQTQPLLGLHHSPSRTHGGKTSGGSPGFEKMRDTRYKCLNVMELLMAEILHQLIGSLSHYLQGFIHPRWCRNFFHQQNHTSLRNGAKLFDHRNGFDMKYVSEKVVETKKNVMKHLKKIHQLLPSEYSLII